MRALLVLAAVCALGVIVAPAQFTQLEAVLDASGALTSYATQYLATHSPLPRAFKITPEIMDDASRRVRGCDLGAALALRPDASIAGNRAA